MEWQSAFVQAVQDDFTARKERNSKYSLRSYASKLGLSSGGLCAMLRRNAHWKITPERAAQVLEKLSLTPEQKNAFRVQMGLPPQHKKASLPEARNEILTDWTYLPILASFDLPAQYRESKAIAQRLGISAKKVEEVIDSLIRLKLLEKSNDGSIYRPQTFLEAKDGPSATQAPSRQDMFRFHDINLELAQKALHQQETERRDFTSLTFVGNQSQIALLREEIRKVYEKASTLISAGQKPDTVYRMSVQLFPMEFQND